jgi:hypothetical protein
LLVKYILDSYYIPVDADGHQIENGRRAAGDVHGDVKVADDVRQIPLAVHLWKYIQRLNQIKSKGTFVTSNNFI